MGNINTLLKLKIEIFLIRIGNLLINTLYCATETFAAAVSQKNVTKIYCEGNKSNGVKSRITLDKTTSLQVKVFSKNSTSLHDNYLK